MGEIVHSEAISEKIYSIRGKRVILDTDLSSLYEVENKQLKRAVKRNIDRFPIDFMFELTKNEYDSIRRQTGTLKRGTHSKYLPYAFTEQGVAMLSSVLRSKRAVQINIGIMRAFVQLRQMVTENDALRYAIEGLEKRVSKNERSIDIAIKAIQGILNPPVAKNKKIKMGFGPPVEKKK